MKMFATMMLGALTALSLSSCGSCSCNSYNKDYLRDVPVSSSQSFDGSY